MFPRRFFTWAFKYVLRLIFYRNTFKITVKTGDKPKQSEVASVFITLYAKGNEAPTQKLEARFKDDFEGGQTDTFEKQHIKLPYEVDSIELRKCNPDDKRDWLINTVRVENMQTEWSREFAVFRRITSNETCIVHDYDTYLPNDVIYEKLPERFEQRQRELKEAKRDYVYKYEDGLPVHVRKLPSQETFSFWYMLKLFLELVLVRVKVIPIAFVNKQWGQNIEGLKNLYTFTTPPSDLDRWMSDEKFGMQRLNGVNSNVICLVRNMAQLRNIKVDQNDKVLSSENLTIKDAIAANRLFIVDHNILQDCPTNEGITLCSPIALFVRNEYGKIVPVAIQLFQNKTVGNPVFTPNDDEITWQLAKMWFNNADAQVHQSIHHLAYTHLIMEGFAVAAHRFLSTSHPVFKILAPHFLNMMAINKECIKSLLGEGKVFDQIMSSGGNGSKSLIAQYKCKWRLNAEGTLPTDLITRGVNDQKVIPYYPFRDDALLTYNAINQYVKDYVNLYYKDDEVLRSDSEVQAWRRDMDLPVSKGGLGIKGVPGRDSKFENKEDLALVLTSIIYTCSVGHAAVNFEQYEEYAFPLNYPSKLMGKPPQDKRKRNVVDILSILPPKPTHLELMTVATLLSKRTTKCLGYFEKEYIQDPAAVELVKKFRMKLRRVSAIIKENNSKRPIELQYLYLDPEHIPNSISI
ncbi:allene oxide synthase-lipoxygenase protein-like [Mya arenaria]|uniref:allene oxide synthase-lipoxygenase protein-like n=1 Tax=Mya arenaria TaxID=6604 RepID=UPI0022E9402F|nr:allene oxide synthase-lipoxygenase protein-like [Mya arenaria]